MIRFLAALLLASSALTAAAADTYVIDPTHTFPRFSINHFGYSTFEGRFDKTSGKISLDQAKKQGSVEATIEVGSVSTGVAKLDQHLMTADFFDAAKYPTITFKSTAFHFDGDKLATVDGNLTIHGATKPVTLKVTSFLCKPHPMAKTPVCGVDAVTTIKRSEFGVAYASGPVGEEVTIRLQVEAKKEEAKQS